VRLLLAAVVGAPAVGVHADVLLNESELIGLPTVAPPSEYQFTAADATPLTVLLTDLKTPAAFASLQIAVTLGDTLVGSATADSTGTATVAVPAVAGSQYVLHVIGTPNSAQGVGSFGVCVAPAASPANCVPDYSYSDNIQTPATASTTGISTLDTNFTAITAGSYTVTLTDDAFPAALQMVSATIFNGSSQIGGIIVAGTPATVTLAAGATYTLLVAAIAGTNPQAGLYGVHITDPSGNAVFDRTVPVGLLGASTNVDAASAQTLTLTLSDVQYPAALASLGATLTAGGLPALATLGAAGSVANVMAPAGTLQVWTYAVAAAQPGVYTLSLASAAASLLASTQVVYPGTASTATSFAFAVNLPSAGSYQLTVNDFQFPSALQALSSSIAQNGKALTQDSSGNVSAAAGEAIVLVNAQAPPSGNGIFAVTVATTGTAPQVLLNQTQAVGGVFDTTTINFGSSGGYDVTLSDLGFPANFQNLSLVLSQGSQVLGKIYGAGTFSISATPGAYVLTFVATPSAQNYGLYGVKMASSAPTVTFTAGAASVAAGQAVQLTWSTKNATACTASGATNWSGNEPASGSSSVIVSATSTYTLSCTGPGGTGSQAVTVSATPAPSSGGGSLDWGLLAGLGALSWLRRATLAGRHGSRPGA
jgi:hypothetical protein